MSGAMDDYAERCVRASAFQGTTAIAEVWEATGRQANVDQTGGFTMCARVQLSERSYVYGTSEGVGLYVCSCEVPAECDGCAGVCDGVEIEGLPYLYDSEGRWVWDESGETPPVMTERGKLEYAKDLETAAAWVAAHESEYLEAQRKEQ